MAISDLFARLDAPLRSVRNSWGSVRAADGVVFLRVWQDEIRVHDGRRYARVMGAQKAEQYREKTGQYKVGSLERLEHAERVRQDSPCFMIMCVAEDVEVMPRRITDYIEDDVFPGGVIIELDGDWWLEICPRIPVNQVAPRR